MEIACLFCIAVARCGCAEGSELFCLLPRFFEGDQTVERSPRVEDVDCLPVELLLM